MNTAHANTITRLMLTPADGGYYLQVRPDLPAVWIGSRAAAIRVLLSTPW